MHQGLAILCFRVYTSWSERLFRLLAFRRILALLLAISSVFSCTGSALGAVRCCALEVGLRSFAICVCLP